MALKVILVNDQESLASAESEARIMAECASPNVVTIFEHWQEDLPGNKKQLLLMELCFGSLRDLINDYGVNNLAIEIDTIRTLARDITKGLAFIHSKGIIHRDLKPENILLSSDGVAKISDFGLSTWHSDGSSHTARIGTRTYRSPEQLLGSSSYTQAVDCWALGCTIAELFYGGYLFDWDTNLALLSQMARILGPINRATMPGDIDVSMVDSIQPPAHFYLLDRLVATNRECADPSSPTESYERSVHCNTSSMASRPVLLATDQENDLLLSLCKLHNPGSDTKREEREKK